MMREDRDALICDMAEVYHVYDMWSLPIRTVATLASGLRDDSRIRRKMNGQKVGADRILMAGILDRLSLLVWMQSTDGVKGRNRPQSILEIMLNQDGLADKLESFSSGEEFDRRWAELTGR